VSFRPVPALAALAAMLGLLSAATAQAPQRPAAQPYSPVITNPLQPVPAPTPNSVPPLFGAPRPNVGPDPTPQIRHAGDCPLGYEAPRNLIQMPHLVVCVVKATNLAALHSPSGPGPAPYGQTSSSMPPILERSTVNQCVGRPAGSYACGRSGSECCSPRQDNMCFAGAFACYPNGTGTGPKTACCMSK
jgi:hypothetical protein